MSANFPEPSHGVPTFSIMGVPIFSIMDVPIFSPIFSIFWIPQFAEQTVQSRCMLAHHFDDTKLNRLENKVKLYGNNMAPNPRRVHIFMAEKGITCENVQLDIVKGENLSDEFLAINPRGMLPTLVLDDGTVIDETVAICRYFEETQPEPALMGTDPVNKALVESKQRHMEWDGLLGAMEAFRNAFPGFASRGLGGNVGTVEAIPALVERGKETLRRFYERLDGQLAASKFIAGDDFTIADITALCTIDFAAGAARVPIPEECANVSRWHTEVSARPSIQG